MFHECLVQSFSAISHQISNISVFEEQTFSADISSFSNMVFFQTYITILRKVTFVFFSTVPELIPLFNPDG